MGQGRQIGTFLYHDVLEHCIDLWTPAKGEGRKALDSVLCTLGTLDFSCQDRI
jgi:hypothetical protein